MSETNKYFAVFNEIHIISQLSGRLFESHLSGEFLVSHFAVLNHLVRLGDGKTPLSIANAFQVPKTTMTHTLSILAKANYIYFEPNPSDARSKYVMMTNSGRKFRDDAIRGMSSEFEKMEENLNPDMMRHLLPLLSELREYLDNNRSS